MLHFWQNTPPCPLSTVFHSTTPRHRYRRRGPWCRFDVSVSFRLGLFGRSRGWDVGALSVRRAWTRVSTLRRSIFPPTLGSLLSCLGIPFSGTPSVQSSHCLVPSRPFPSPTPQSTPHVVLAISSSPTQVTNNRPHWGSIGLDSSASLKPHLLPEWLTFLTKTKNQVVSMTGLSRSSHQCWWSSMRSGRGTRAMLRESQATMSFLKGQHHHDTRPWYGIEAWLSSRPKGTSTNPLTAEPASREKRRPEAPYDIDPKKRRKKGERLVGPVQRTRKPPRYMPARRGGSI